MEATATAELLPHDRVCDWHDEVDRILPRLPSLPPGAQAAVRAVIASLVEEEATVRGPVRRRRAP